MVDADEPTYAIFAAGDTLTVGDGVDYDYSSIQQAINAAKDGDTVLIARGTYFENLQLSGKTIRLASNYIITSDPQDILLTIIDGNGGKVCVQITDVGPETTIVGVTIKKGDDGISANTHFNFLHSRISECIDGLDYESGGGICKFNVFENNSDDGIDLDGSSEAIIAYNRIINNSDDGIEIRLHDYDGPLLTTIISNNLIMNNKEDGIQLIDYPDLTERVFYIENNVIARNTMAGIGCMADGRSTEDYQAADIPEKVFVINNTLVNNYYGITGGDNMIVKNNIFAMTTETALKKVDGNSIVTYNAFWQNKLDLDGTSSAFDLHVDPGFADIGKDDYHLKSQAGRWNENTRTWFRDEVTSPCIDAGDITSSIGHETFPNGARINIGAYGGTPQASKTYFQTGQCSKVISGDINGDCFVNYIDFSVMAFNWLESSIN